MMPPRVLASGPKPCGGNKIYIFVPRRNSFTFIFVHSFIHIVELIMALSERRKGVAFPDIFNQNSLNNVNVFQLYRGVL